MDGTQDGVAPRGRIRRGDGVRDSGSAFSCACGSETKTERGKAQCGHPAHLGESARRHQRDSADDDRRSRRSSSDNTKTKNIDDIKPGDFKGRYVRYGIREHGMAAAMNGMALHRGVIPYSGTFLIFSDYMRPSIRLAALMGVHVIFVMTHDSIGVGEDGPTHQPVEHLPALRAIPNLTVIRPADAVETVEAWEIALNTKKGPTLLAFSRQDVPTIRTQHVAENLVSRGAYEIAGADNAKLSLLATGSEVGLALQTRDILKADGIAARVVSMPCWSLFEQQSETYREQVLGKGTVKVAIEAAVREGWDRYIGAHGRFVGMHSFGASGPYKDVYKHFAITPEAAAEAARAALND
jgi:transketolase